MSTRGERRGLWVSVVVVAVAAGEEGRVSTRTRPATERRAFFASSSSSVLQVAVLPRKISPRKSWSWQPLRLLLKLLHTHNIHTHRPRNEERRGEGGNTAPWFLLDRTHADRE